MQDRMKRQGRLIEKIAALENLQLAYYKAKKGKAAKNEVIKFTKQLRTNLKKLQKQIITGNIDTGNYHYFTIYDPKKRQICAAPFEQRVLHHAIMNICHPFFEKVQIFDSYASRPGKGTHAAFFRAKHFNRHLTWFLKLDFRKYFDSLDHAVLKNQLVSLFKDKKLLEIFDKIIESYSVHQNKGVPIGNLTSQYFANHYLAGFDHFIKEIVRIKAYVRYMDDMVLWHDRKEILLKTGLRIKKYAERNLKLRLKPFCLNRNEHGLPFLGYLLYPDKIRLSQRSRTRFSRKLKKYESNLRLERWSQKEYQDHVFPLIAFTEYAHAKEFRKEIIKDFT